MECVFFKVYFYFAVGFCKLGSFLEVLDVI